MQIKTKLQYGSSSSLLYFFLPSCSFDDNCSAGRPYLCARRARSRRPHTHATCERRNDANASSEEVVVDVEVDRYIDEISASNLNCCCLYFFHRSSIIRHNSLRSDLFWSVAFLNKLIPHIYEGAVRRNLFG